MGESTQSIAHSHARETDCLPEPPTDSAQLTFYLSAKKKELLAVFVTRCDSDSSF